MTEGDTVFAADGAHIGSIDAIDETAIQVRGDGHTFRIPRDRIGYEHDGRVFLVLPNRHAVHLWRGDVRRAGGLRGWWERVVLGPSPHPLGGPLHD